MGERINKCGTCLEWHTGQPTERKEASIHVTVWMNLKTAMLSESSHHTNHHLLDDFIDVTYPEEVKSTEAGSRGWLPGAGERKD